MQDAQDIGARRDSIDASAAPPARCPDTDWSAIDDGVALAYATAHLPRPAYIVRCGGPLEIAERLANASVSDPIGQNVKSNVYDFVRNRVSTVAEVFCKEVLDAATALAERPRVRQESVERAVKSVVDRRLGKLSPKIRDIARRLRGRPRLLPISGFDEIAVGPAQFASIAILASLKSATGYDDALLELDGLAKIAAHAGWFVPYENVCFVSEQPEVLKTDAQGRLHCADGPALRYRDGCCIWSWKGVEVPAWAIEHPENITVSRLDDEVDPAVRHALIEIMTPERLIASGAAECLARDETGILWGMSWTYRGLTLDRWRAVEIIDGAMSFHHHILPVPSDMCSPREAVSWAYGMTATRT